MSWKRPRARRWAGTSCRAPHVSARRERAGQATCAQPLQHRWRPALAGAAPGCACAPPPRLRRRSPCGAEPAHQTGGSVSRTAPYIPFFGPVQTAGRGPGVRQAAAGCRHRTAPGKQQSASWQNAAPSAMCSTYESERREARQAAVTGAPKAPAAAPWCNRSRAPRWPIARAPTGPGTAL